MGEKMYFLDMTIEQQKAYFEQICSKRYDPLIVGDQAEQPELIDSILTANADMEQYIIQASAYRTPFLGVGYEPLQFVHFSDLHAMLELWNRIMEFINHYSDYIAFGLHTGDYCCQSQEQFRDCYAEGIPCVRPVLNCVGNHDTIDQKRNLQSKHSTWEKLFNHTDDWNVEFMALPNPTSYHRDFPQSNIRLIVLDLYYDTELQRPILQQLLEDARERGLCVITAMHEHPSTFGERLDIPFQTITPYRAEAPDIFDEIIAEFKEKGGVHICNLCGHHHTDWFGYTKRGTLSIAVESAADYAGWCDAKRIRGTRTYDSFNLVCVDTNLGLLKLVRIGNQTDYYLRSKKTLCYDYLNKKVISCT